MTTPRRPVRVAPSAKAASRTSKPRTLATQAKSSTKTRGQPRPAASQAKPSETRAGEKTTVVPSGGDPGSASRLIDQRIRDLAGWRGETLGRMRALILEAEPEAVEEWKWMGTPVWSRDGIICTGESYTKAVKLTFARGASIPDSARLFNSSLEGNMRRAIDIPEGAKVDAVAFKALVKAAVAQNALLANKRSKPRTSVPGSATAPATSRASKRPKSASSSK